MADIGWVSADNPVVQQIDDAALRYGVDRNLAHVVAQMESNYTPTAVSPVGAQGVMQIMPATGQTLGLRHPFDSAENVDAGVRLLGDLVRKYGADYKRVLAAYNAGEPAVDKAGGVPDFPETQDYVTKGMSLLYPRPAQTQAPAAPPADSDIGWVAAPEAQKPAEPSPVEKAGTAYWHGIGPVIKTLFDLGQGMSGNPLDQARAGWTLYNAAQGLASELPGWTPSGGFRPGRALSEWGQTGNALMQGRFRDALYHLGGAVPFLGGQSQEIAQDVNRNDPAATVGHTASMLTQWLGPEAFMKIAPVVGDATTFAGGAIPEAAKAAVKRGNWQAMTAGELGYMVGGPKYATAAAALTKAYPVIKAGVAGGRAALEEAAASAAAEEATRAAAAATAREAADAALARQAKIYETGEAMTQPPARPELPPGSSYQMPEAGSYAEEQRIQALRPEGGQPPGLPALTLEQLTQDRFPGKSFSDLSADQQAQLRAEYQGLQQPAFQGLFGQPQAAPPAAAVPPALTSNDLARSLYGNRPLTDTEAANVQNLYTQVGAGQPPAPPTSPRVMSDAEAAQVFPGMGVQPGSPGEPPPAPSAPAPTRTLAEIQGEISQRLSNLQNLAKQPQTPDVVQRTSAQLSALGRLKNEQPIPPGTVFGVAPSTVSTATPAAPAAPVVPEPPPAAPAVPPVAEAPTSPLAAKPTAREIAKQLENEMRPGLLTDYLKANRVPRSMVDQFGEKQWDYVAQGAHTQPPTPEQIAEIKQNLGEYEQAANPPSTVAQMTPAEAEAAVAPALKPEPAAPTAPQTRVEAFAQHFANETQMTPDQIRAIAKDSGAARRLEELGRALKIKGTPAPGEIEQIADRVGELRRAAKK